MMGGGGGTAREGDDKTGNELTRTIVSQMYYQQIAGHACAVMISGPLQDI